MKMEGFVPEEETEFNTSDSSMFTSILISQIFGKEDPKQDYEYTAQDKQEKPRDVHIKSHLGENPFQTYMQEDFIDLNIIVDKNIIGVHQLVVSAHSDLVAGLLKDKQVELSSEHILGFSSPNIGERTSIILPNYPLQIMTKVVNFLYSGELIYSQEDIQEMNAIARDLQLKFLLKQLEDVQESLVPNGSTEQVGFSSSTISQQNFISLNALDESYEIVIGPDIRGIVPSSQFGNSEAVRSRENPEKILDHKVDPEAEGPVYLVERDLETPVQSPTETPVKESTEPAEESICNYSILSDITRHLETIDESQVAQPSQQICNLCNQFIENINDLNQHLCQKQLPPAEDLQCGVCKNYFNSNDALINHQRAAHAGKGYSCEECKKTFTRAQQLKIHKRIHSGKKPYPCTECNKRFVDNSSLKKHMKIHSDEYGYKCVKCDKSFRLNNILRQHMQTHEAERPYRCNVCNKGFTFKRNMLRHIEIHTQVNNKIKKQHQLLKCNYCHQSFTGEVQLLEHNRLAHPDTLEASRSLVFRCWMRNCDKVFPSEELLSSHQQIVHESHQHIVQEITDNQNSANLPDKSANEIDKSAALMDNSANKVPTPHTGPLICNCGVRFVNAKTLRQHQKTSHSSGGQYKCTLCTQGFQNECDLMQHILDHTNKKKKHICGYCSKAFERPSDLAKHIRVHTGEKPYHCEVCDRRFADLSLFKKHKRKHEDSLSYICDICSKSFQILSNLEKHKQTHSSTSISCSVCSKVFYDDANLRAHMNLHSGTYSFTCTYCNKAFAHSYDLKKHERVHTKEQPYSCGQCSKKYSDLSFLRRHERTHVTTMM